MMKIKLLHKNLLLLILALMFISMPLVMQIAPEYSGTDSQAVSMIAEVDPNYQPWISNWFKLPGSEMESLMFALQAALGAGVLGFILGRLTARPNPEKEEGKSSGQKGQR